jgi:hypothetical protein
MITITIETDNAAFKPKAQYEVARILRHLAADIENGEENVRLRDVNGNTVGAMTTDHARPSVYVVLADSRGIDSAWRDRAQAHSRATALTHPDHPQGPLGELLRVTLDTVAEPEHIRVEQLDREDPLPVEGANHEG